MKVVVKVIIYPEGQSHSLPVREGQANLTGEHATQELAIAKAKDMAARQVNETFYLAAQEGRTIK